MVMGWAAISQIASLFILKTIVSYSIRDYLKSVLWPLLAVMIVTFWPALFIHEYMTSGFIRFLIVGITSVSVSSLGIYYIALNRSERGLINSFLSKFKQKWQK